MLVNNPFIIDLAYIAASILFIGHQDDGEAESSRRGNMLSAAGMLIAVVASLYECCISFTWIVPGLVIGSTIGFFAARLVQMTAMPQMVALFNGFGGLASVLVGWENYHSQPLSTTLVTVATFLRCDRRGHFHRQHGRIRQAGRPDNGQAGAFPCREGGKCRNHGRDPPGRPGLL